MSEHQPDTLNPFLDVLTHQELTLISNVLGFYLNEDIHVGKIPFVSREKVIVVINSYIDQLESFYLFENSGPHMSDLELYKMILKKIDIEVWVDITTFRDMGRVELNTLTGEKRKMRL